MIVLFSILIFRYIIILVNIVKYNRKLIVKFLYSKIFRFKFQYLWYVTCTHIFAKKKYRKLNQNFLKKFRQGYLLTLYYLRKLSEVIFCLFKFVKVFKNQLKSRKSYWKNFKRKAVDLNPLRSMKCWIIA